MNQKKCVNHRFHWLNQRNWFIKLFNMINYIIWFIFWWNCFIFRCSLRKNQKVSYTFPFWWNCFIYSYETFHFYLKNTEIWNNFIKKWTIKHNFIILNNFMNQFRWFNQHYATHVVDVLILSQELPFIYSSYYLPYIGHLRFLIWSKLDQRVFCPLYQFISFMIFLAYYYMVGSRKN